MDRHIIGDWVIECNQGRPCAESDLVVYENSFISFQNHKSGISFEMHTYEALELTNKLVQNQLLDTSEELPGNSVSYFKSEENNFYSTYKGRVKPIHLHGKVKINQSSLSIPFERLGPNYQILWATEINFFSKNNANEKSNFFVKARVMENSFYLLSRMSVVNKSFVKILDTRVFHAFECNFLIRNFTVKENTLQELATKGFTPSIVNGRVDENICQALDSSFTFTDQIIL